MWQQHSRHLRIDTMICISTDLTSLVWKRLKNVTQLILRWSFNTNGPLLLRFASWSANLPCQRERSKRWSNGCESLTWLSRWTNLAFHCRMKVHVRSKGEINWLTTATQIQQWLKDPKERFKWQSTGLNSTSQSTMDLWWRQQRTDFEQVRLTLWPHQRYSRLTDLSRETTTSKNRKYHNSQITLNRKSMHLQSLLPADWAILTRSHLNSMTTTNSRHLKGKDHPKNRSSNCLNNHSLKQQSSIKISLCKTSQFKTWTFLALQRPQMLKI